MSDEKKQGDENWVDATPEHVMSVFNGEVLKARFKEHETNPNWVSTDVDGYEMTLRGWDRGSFIDSEGEQWEACQVYCEPVPQESVEPVQTQKKQSGMDQASLWGAEPIEVRPIMQIRLPVAASVLGALSGVFEKHYPGSVMRQAGDYLIFEEPIEL
jgi:hypothetical protein